MARSQPLPHRNQQPEYAAALAEINRLNAALAPIRSRISEIELLLNAAPSAADRNAGHVDAAMHFVETGTVRRSQDSESLREDHALLREQAEALTMTIRQKTDALYSIEQRLSHEALRNASGDLEDIRSRYVAALRALDAIAKEERDLLNAMNAQGYYPSLPNPVAWPLIGTLEDSGSSISMHARELGGISRR